MTVKKADGFYALSEDGKDLLGGPYRRRISAQLREVQGLPPFDGAKPRMDGQKLTEGPVELARACYGL